MERFEDLAKSMTKEMGAPIKFSRNSQADSGIGHLKGFIESLKKQSEERSSLMEIYWFVNQLGFVH